MILQCSNLSTYDVTNYRDVFIFQPNKRSIRQPLSHNHDVLTHFIIRDCTIQCSLWETCKIIYVYSVVNCVRNLQIFYYMYTVL